MANPSLSRFSRLFRLLTVTAAVGAAAGGGAMLLGGGVASCLTTESYVYVAQKYAPTGDCLESYAAVEVVNGSGAGSTCPAACLTVGAELFVSTMCPPLPTVATEVPADAGDCVAALAAAKRGGTCGAPPDAGEPDADGDTGAGDPDGGGDPDAQTDAADANVKIQDAGDAG